MISNIFQSHCAQSAAAALKQNACKMLSIFNFLFFPYLRSEGHPWDLFNPNCLLSTALLVQHSSPLCTNACAPESAGPTDFSYLPIVIAIASLSKLSKIKSKCKKPTVYRLDIWPFKFSFKLKLLYLW